MKSSSVQPPIIAVRLIDLFVPETQHESVKGDLLEEFSDLATRFGDSSARRWYWKHSTKTIASLMFRMPWVVALVVLSGFIILLNVVDLVMADKIVEDRAQLATSLGRPMLWFLLGSMVISSVTPSWVLAMIAKGKEIVATSLFALMFVLSAIAAQLGIRVFQLHPRTPLPHPIFLALSASLIVFAGIVVRQMRSINNRRARG